MSFAVYYLFSTLPGEPNLGIYYLTPKQEDQERQQQGSQDEPTGQPVRLGADFVQWVASPQVGKRGPVRLSVGPYQYTTLKGDEVFATNQAQFSRDFYLIPNDKQEYLISADPVGNAVWTAGDLTKPITIKRFTGEPNQLFKFVRRSM